MSKKAKNNLNNIELRLHVIDDNLNILNHDVMTLIDSIRDFRPRLEQVERKQTENYVQSLTLWIVPDLIEQLNLACWLSGEDKESFTLRALKEAIVKTKTKRTAQQKKLPTGGAST